MIVKEAILERIRLAELRPQLCDDGRRPGKTRTGRGASDMSERLLGWDIGGAHLKLALVEDARIAAALQLPCALWRGLDELRHAISAALADLPAADRHAVPLTRQLTALFP